MAVNLEYRDRLRDLVLREGVRRGAITLASGQRSDYYIDCRKVTTHPQGAFLVAEIILDMLAGDDVAAIGGPTLGADPIVGAVCYASHCRGRPLHGFMVRKATKQHGMQNLIEGHLPPGGRVAVIEDVLTTGGSVLRAVQAVEKAGARVVCVVGVVDRLAGAREKLETADRRFSPIFTIDDLGLAGEDRP
ncbi:MAG: orotate phosphoribosyltransferase [bacterium]